MTGRVRRLDAFPRNQLLEVPLMRGRVTELDLLANLGEPTDASEPLADEPCFYWDLVWGCGLVMALRFHQLSEKLVMHLDGPEVEHALRHLGVEVHELETLEVVKPELFTTVVGGPVDRGWEVVGDGIADGAVVAAGLTERDARCLAEEAGATSGAGYLVRRG